MTVLDTESGKVIAVVPIGEGCDGAGFDPETGLAFCSNGEGTLTVVQEMSPGKFEVVETVATRSNARTMTIDPKTHSIYLPAAQLHERGGTMNRIGLNRFITLLCFYLVLCHKSLLAWGPDIPIWTAGTVNCFDTEYTVDGTMFVAFQPQGQNVICVYESRDRGNSWKPLWSTEVGSVELKRVRIVADEDFKRIFLFYRSVVGGKLHARWVNWEEARNGTQTEHTMSVSNASIVDGSFDVAYYNWRFFAVWLEDYSASQKRIRIERSNDWAGDSFDGIPLYEQVYDWSADEGTRTSMVCGPNQRVDATFSSHSGTGSAIQWLHSTNFGTTWQLINLSQSSQQTGRYYDPRVAFSNTSTIGGWVVYNSIRFGTELDLYGFHVTGSSLTSIDCGISTSSGISEYIADIKNYKIYPNEYLNVVFIGDEAATFRRGIWAWTSPFQSQPFVWNDRTEFADRDITSWPEDAAPRLVYSPGSWAGGSGVVFSYYLKQGLYFDSPWNHVSGGLLVVSPEEFQEDLIPLINWKNETGIPAYGVAWEEIAAGSDYAAGNDCAEKIKYAIDHYYKDHLVRYLMLVGDSDILPVRYSLHGYEEGIPFPEDMLNKEWVWQDESGNWQNEWWYWCNGGPWYPYMDAFVPNFFVTELYFADLYNSSGQFQTWDPDGNGYFGECYRNNLNPEELDLYPDVAVGRVPASSKNEVQNYVQKVIAYESNASNRSGWKRTLVLASDERTEWVNSGRSVNRILADAGLDTGFVILDSQSGESGDSYINRELQQGLGFMMYIGHGPYGMGLPADWLVTPPLGDQFPIVCHTGCHPGDFGPNLLTFRDGGYRDKYGVVHANYEEGQHYPSDQYPPPPHNFQLTDEDDVYAEFLICSYPDQGAIVYLASTYATQDPSYDMGEYFFEGYTRGHKIVGDMWMEAVSRYLSQHVFNQSPSKDMPFRGEYIWNWVPVDQFFMPQKFVLFGDPSLRVGGILGGYQTAVPDGVDSGPREFQLVQNYPNPFNDETIINYEVQQETEVLITIYNVLGQRVDTLVQKTLMPGSYSVRWGGRDALGYRVLSGIYIVKMTAGTYQAQGKMILLR